MLNIKQVTFIHDIMHVSLHIFPKHMRPQVSLFREQTNPRERGCTDSFTFCGDHNDERINRTILGTELNDTQNGTIRRLIIFVTVAFSIICSIVPRPLRYVPPTAARNCAITNNCANYWSKSNNTALSRWLFNARTLITLQQI